MATFKEYSRRRESILRRWTASGLEVEALYKIGVAARSEAAKVYNFVGRFATLERFFTNFETATEHMHELNYLVHEIDPSTLKEDELLSEFPDAAQKKLCQEVRAWYMACQEMHVKFNESKPIVGASPPGANATILNSSELANTSILLPKIPLPKFDGTHELWVPFRDVFVSLVHQNNTLTGTQKFHHLIGALQGEAKSVIAGAPLTDDGYPTAWKSLNSAYDNPRLLATVYVNKLLNATKLDPKPTLDALKGYLSNVSDMVAAFKGLKIPEESDFLLFTLAVRNLPQVLREEFQMTIKDDEFPSTEKLTQFVRGRQLAMQLAAPEKNFASQHEGAQPRKPSGQGNKRGILDRGPTTRTSLVTTQGPRTPTPSITCIICSAPHTLFRCAKFNELTPADRYAALKNWKGCKLCFAYGGHETKECKSGQKCRLCSRPHNAMLCFAKPSPPVQPKPQHGGQSSAPAPTLMGTSRHSNEIPAQETQVLLGTLQISIFDARGQLQSMRAVLDSGSQFSYITRKAINQLGLVLIKTPRKISTLGGALFDSAQGIVRGTVHGKNQVPDLSTEFVVVRAITSALPTFPVSDTIRRKFAKFQLADVGWAHPADCQVLIGADLFPELVLGTPRAIGDNLPRLISTVYGEVIIGRLVETHPPSPVLGTSLFSTTLQEGNLAFDLQRFWENEEIPGDNPPPTPTRDVSSDDLAELKFVQGYYRLESGKFGVRLPFTQDPIPDLSGSRAIARKRLLNLETKFRKNPDLKRAYVEFMDEYESLGHATMLATKSTPANNGNDVTQHELYTIPHHAVFNKSKIRVVFDGSAGDARGSLNSYLLPGPPLQNDLRKIIMNFRSYAYAFTTDVVKMFRNIEVDPRDRAYQTILWRRDEADPIKTYTLNTVTYGLSSSPFHALRCMKQLQLESQDEFPLASKAMETQVYVDDFICGAGTLSEALQLKHELIAVMKRGGFELAKWASNSPTLIEQTDSVSDVEFSPDNSPEPTKVLGLKWNVRHDHFRFNVQRREEIIPTKRIILSTVSRIFDPIGLISPLTVSFKLIIQQLWSAKLGWDDKIPSSLDANWHRLIDELDDLIQLKIPRRVTLSSPCTYQLVGFCDASEAAMCCVLYLRAVSHERTIVNLLTSKTKVAPLKIPLTIPRLELTAALMLAKLYHSLTEFQASLGEYLLPPKFFTDSMVALAWIQKVPSSHLRVFVGNRVTEIRKLTHSNNWDHISGKLNPADLGSRGLSPRQLVGNAFWFNGPSFLSGPDDAWPVPTATIINDNLDIPELKAPIVSSPVTLLSFDNTSQLVDWMNRFSNYRLLLRVVARILRFIHNKRNPTATREGEFLLVEIVQAFFTCVKVTQLYHFLKGNPNNFKAVHEQFRTLSPFADDQGIIRVGGRIRHAPLDYAHRHPVLLPHNAKFTILFIEHYHVSLMHPAPSLLQAIIARRVWVPGARRLVRTVTRKCVTCFSSRASTMVPMMGDLPTYRLTAQRAFINVGLDFAGPFAHKTSLLRKAVISKMYFCVYVCMASKAIHIEIVTDLSTKAFMASFFRFISRRGKPTRVFSDNGGNFVGASRELKELYQWFNNHNTQDEITRMTVDEGIDWSFTPPYAPAFGGLWEAAVKSVKFFIKNSVGETPLTYEEFSTLLCQVEALLNSRPLCPLSDSPDDYQCLTPGHFLIGAPLQAPPERSILEQPINNLQRWQMVKRAYQTIWARFSLEYLSTLQKRTKWTVDHPNLQIGDLVLLKVPDAQPCNWPTARVIEIHPGSDHKTRVVTIRTPNGGTYKRSVATLIPLLPINEATREKPEIIPHEG